jgi:hypothetical protein
MMKPPIFILAAVCFAVPACAQTLLTDAFGVFDASTDAARTEWAGVSAPIAAPGALAGDGTFVSPSGAEMVLIHFGEKSLPQGSGTALIAALVLDRHGNLVADGTGVSLVAADARQSAPSIHGIASRPVAAGEAPGQHFAWAETAVGGAPRQSPRVSYRVVPALSQQAALLVGPVGQLRTEDVAPFDAALVRDEGMEDLLDGMAAQIVLTHGSGAHSLVPAQWVGGRLHARLLTREVFGRAEAQLHMPFARSAPIALDITPVRASGPLRVAATSLPDIAATRLALGPITTGTGHLLHDGSQLRVAVTDAAGEDFEAAAWTLDGVADVTVPSIALPFAVEVLTPAGGLSQTVTRTEATQ